MPLLDANLASDSFCIADAGWLNLDYASAASSDQSANLLDRLPLANGTANIVYSSHFLEYIPSTWWRHSFRSAGAFSTPLAC